MAIAIAVAIAIAMAIAIAIAIVIAIADNIQNMRRAPGHAVDAPHVSRKLHVSAILLLCKTAKSAWALCPEACRGP